MRKIIIFIIIITLIVLATFLILFYGKSFLTIKPTVNSFESRQKEIGLGYAEKEFYNYENDYCIQYPNLKIPLDCYQSYLESKITNVLIKQKFTVDNREYTYFDSNYYHRITWFGDLEQSLASKTVIYLIYHSAGPGHGSGDYNNYRIPEGYELLDVVLKYDPNADEKLSSKHFFDPKYGVSVKKIAERVRKKADIEFKDHLGLYITNTSPSYVKTVGEKIIFFENQDVNDVSRSPGPCYPAIIHLPVFYVDTIEGSIEQYTPSGEEIAEANNQSEECSRLLNR